MPGSACPTAWAIRPQFGVAAVQRGLDQRRVGDRARDALDARLVAAAHDDAADAPAPSPSRTMSSASWRSSASSASPKRSSSSVSGATATPLAPAGHEDRGVVRRELAVDADAVERALDADAEQQVGGLGASARVGLHEAQHRREARLDHARALGLGGEPDRPAGSSTSSVARLSNASVVRIAAREVAVAVGAQLGRRAASRPLDDLGRRAGRR